jgi:carbon monoxide dehydrogenase subunit G
MDMTGSHRIPAPPWQVWSALNDPQVLRRSIPGCETLNRVSETGFTATITARVGPVKVRFTGRVRLSGVEPPHRYTLDGEGRGGAGFIRGTATFTLTPEPDTDSVPPGTVLGFTIHVRTGGLLARLGSRLINATAWAMAEAFFSRLVAEVAATNPRHRPAAPAARRPPPRTIDALLDTAALAVALLAVRVLK